MLICRTGFCVVVLLLAACGADSGTPQTAPASAAIPGKQRENVSCADHFTQARQAILGTLRGTQHRPLIALTTELSIDAQPTGLDAASRLTRNCSIHSRRLHESQQAGSAQPRTLSSTCAALVDRIDKQCLQPLQERGEPLSRHCHGALLGLTGAADDMDQKLGDDDHCATLDRSLQ